MDIKDRIKMIMERENLPAGAFAERIGVAQATISHILSGRNKYPSMDVILRLHKQYSHINLEWLLTGDGAMSMEDESTSMPSEYAENTLFPDDEADNSEYRKENALGNAPTPIKEVVRQEIVYKEKAPRKITEIRIFFDDNTYEIFTPKN